MDPFTNRQEAGKILAKKLAPLGARDPVVLALPRGGIPVAAEIASALGAPLDILAVKKIGAPDNPELAVGAVSEDGEPVFHEGVINALSRRRPIDRSELKRVSEKKAAEVREQLVKFRRECPVLDVAGRDVILVDDGLATGATAEAAVQVLRKRGAGRIVLAVPVAAPDSVGLLREKVDDLVVLLAPADFYAVGAWYHDFSEVTDAEAIGHLRRLREREQVHLPGSDFREREVCLSAGARELEGDFFVPNAASGVVIFAHGSGSSRKSPRNRQVAQALAEAGFASLLLDLLTPAEAEDRKNVFDVDLLAERLVAARKWVVAQLSGLPVAYFGASTGAGAALRAAAMEPRGARTVVSRGGRPDLAGASLEDVACPVLLIVGGEDGAVIGLNREAGARLKHSELAIVPGATHLFEEPGCLEEVIRLTVAWLERHLAGPAGGRPAAGTGMAADPVDAELARLARPLHSRSVLEALAEKFADRRVVMLGESTHGTQEFYSLRRELSQILMERFGFRFVAVEGDWPDCQRLNEYARSGLGDSARRVAEGFSRWPTWMWANEEVVKLVEWMRGWGAGFFGLDVYSLFESLEVMRQTAEKLGVELSNRALELHACFQPFRGDEISYAKSLLKFPDGCRELALENLHHLLGLRLGTVSLNDRELFDAQQNARVVRNAEQYYRAMLAGNSSSWNVRDQHMMETLDILLDRHGEGAKAIVWAHNTHIGDYRFTDMVDEGFVNIGGLARELYGRENVGLIGFTTFGGTVLAGRAWGAPEQAMDLPEARPGSLDDRLHHLIRASGVDPGLALVFDSRSRRGPLSDRMGHRAVGVVYNSAYEISGQNYVPTVVPERYDALIFVDRSHALESLHRPAAPGLFPETWPSGA